MSDADIVKDFLVESYENLDRLDRDLIALEKDPRDSATLASIFRTIHTIKGTSGFLAFNQLEKVTHVGENMLALLRDGALSLSPEITTALLALVDAVRQMLSNIEATGTDGERDDAKLIKTLTKLQQPSGATPDAPKKSVIPPSKKEKKAALSGESSLETECAKGTHVATTVEKQKEGDPGRGDDIMAESSIRSQEMGETPNPQQAPRGQSASDSTIRVDVALLDQLMNLVGELVLARNQILQFANSAEEGGLVATSQRLNLITTELQEGVMKTRMQPIGNIWSKFPRTVRDVAMGCGKQVRIEMVGKETELDKTIIEAIKDPLTHLVRNAVDHGIEAPEARKAAGKNPEGLLFLRAFHEGGQVNIEISDDGAGLDLDKIRKKAVLKGLVSSEQALRMTDREVTNLIFLPGLSTAEKVTNVSGRGVGMDVVKTNIEKIGGTVDLQSKAGQGSTVRMKIPLTLAIIPALMVTSGGDRYAIPQVSLLELVRLEGEQAEKGIELIHGAPVYRLRGHLLPLVYLNGELKVGRNAHVAKSPAPDKNKEVIDFAMARQAHKSWIEKLEAVLDDKLAMTVADAGSPKLCALGKWIYSVGMQNYGALAEMIALEKAHEEFHRMVQTVLVLKQGGASVQAQQQTRDLAAFSEKIIELLTNMEKKVDDSRSANIVVLQADDRQFGLVVDEINDTEEIVVKPLSKQLKNINTYAGATIMGDGKVALILDVLGLAQRVNVVNEVRNPTIAEKEEGRSEVANGRTQCNAVLVFQHGQTGRTAIDLSLVARLEEFPHDAIEVAADREVVQYRGQIMPLLRVSEVIGNARDNSAASKQESLQVVVYTQNGRSIGLVVERILDIVEESYVLQPQQGRKGILGSAVIQKRVTDVLDVPGLIAATGDKWPAGVEA